jgi:hypothetical protein
MIYGFMEYTRNDTTDREKPKNLEKTLTQCHFVHHKHTWTEPDANPDLWGERPVTNRLSHGTAYLT